MCETQSSPRAALHAHGAILSFMAVFFSSSHELDKNINLFVLSVCLSQAMQADKQP